MFIPEPTNNLKSLEYLIYYYIYEESKVIINEINHKI